MGSAVLTTPRWGRVYVINTAAGPVTFTTLDAATGHILHAVPLGGAAYPVLDAPTHRWFVLDRARGRLVVLDALSGRVVGTVRVTVSAQPAGLPLLMPDERSGRVALLDPFSATLSIFDGVTGRRLHAVYLGDNALTIGVDEQRGRVLVASLGALDQRQRPVGDGSLRVVDERSGRIVRTVRVGQAPYVVAVDGRSGRTLVENTGGGTTTQAEWWGWLPSWLRRRLPFLPPPSTRPVPASLTLLNTSRL